jgi:uncharacterized protein (TIGR02246 family)
MKPDGDFQAQAQQSADQWDKAFNERDAARVAQTYARDAVVLPPFGGPLVRGPEGAQAFYEDVIGKGFTDHKVTIDTAEVRGELGYAYGRWETMGPGPDGLPKRYEGHWTNVYVTEAGEWRTVLHIWN